MEEAFREGQKGRYSAPPNPWVGCVIVSNEGKIIGRGFHEKPGTPHAEVKAFEDADANNTTSNIFSQSKKNFLFVFTFFDFCLSQALCLLLLNLVIISEEPPHVTQPSSNAESNELLLQLWTPMKEYQDKESPF